MPLDMGLGDSSLSAVQQKVIMELSGCDGDMIAERVLSYIRELKQSLAMAKLKALYSDEEIAAMIEKAKAG